MWSRGTGSAVPSRVSLLISILGLNLVLTYGIPPNFRGGVHYLFKPPYAIGSVPSLWGHAIIAHRWRSLPRVRRHRASKPQGSSKRVLPWQVAMDQFMCASLSHTHYRSGHVESTGCRLSKKTICTTIRRSDLVFFERVFVWLV